VVGDLSDCQCEDLATSGLYSLFVSVAGMNWESYAKYRVLGQLAQIFSNLKRLMAAKIRLGSPTLIL